MRSFKLLPVLAIVTVVAVVGCGGGGSPGGVPASQATSIATPSAGSSPVTSPPAAAQPSVLTIVAPGDSDVPIEAALKQIWQGTGEPAAPVDCTKSPTVDPAGHVWVAPCWANSFWVFDEDGAFVEPWGTKGSDQDSSISSCHRPTTPSGASPLLPTAPSTRSTSAISASSTSNSKRKILGSWGSFGSEDGQFAKPTDLAVGPDGQVYVADGARGNVQVFDPDGTFSRSIGEAVGQPDHFAWFGIDGDGNVYAAEQNHSIVKYAADGQPLFQIDCAAISGDTTDTAVDPDGNIFVTFTSDEEPFMRGLLEFDAEGTLEHRWPGIGDYIAVVDNGTAIIATNSHEPYVKKFALPKD